MRSASAGKWSPRLDHVIEGLVEQIESRYADVSQQMSDPAVIADRQRYAVAQALTQAEAAKDAFARLYSG